MTSHLIKQMQHMDGVRGRCMGEGGPGFLTSWCTGLLYPFLYSMDPHLWDEDEAEGARGAEDDEDGYDDEAGVLVLVQHKTETDYTVKKGYSVHIPKVCSASPFKGYSQAQEARYFLLRNTLF
jgi:hypothetical protein